MTDGLTLSIDALIAPQLHPDYSRGEGVRIVEVVDALGDHLDDKSIAALTSLIEQFGDNELHLPVEDADIAPLASSIEERLENIFRLGEAEIKPYMKIAEKDTVDFYLAHPELWAYSRSELYSKHKSLYSKLVKFPIFDFLVPVRRGSFGKMWRGKAASRIKSKQKLDAVIPFGSIYSGLDEPDGSNKYRSELDCLLSEIYTDGPVINQTILDRLYTKFADISRIRLQRGALLIESKAPSSPNAKNYVAKGNLTFPDQIVYERKSYQPAKMLEGVNNERIVA